VGIGVVGVTSHVCGVLYGAYSHLDFISQLHPMTSIAQVVRDVSADSTIKQRRECRMLQPGSHANRINRRFAAINPRD
jgi:hypothetical protein